ncbi:hypothetical protein LCGC14_2571940 [marine sediment metagenome]|uniref:Uncharacterized protein n=1 Tax=marine sediment metagenome TaxID=412755 RepID=A0A0F9CT54_9ZZZZ
MDEEVKKAIDEAQQQVLKMFGQFNKVVEQLAATLGLEYSNDIKDWVSKKKLQELKKNPRDAKD